MGSEKNYNNEVSDTQAESQPSLPRINIVVTPLVKSFLRISHQCVRVGSFPNENYATNRTALRAFPSAFASGPLSGPSNRRSHSHLPKSLGSQSLTKDLPSPISRLPRKRHAAAVRSHSCEQCECRRTCPCTVLLSHLLYGIRCHQARQGKKEKRVFRVLGARRCHPVTWKPSTQVQTAEDRLQDARHADTHANAT
ncbi:hypothetical protein GE21DRAFT_4841 [Neurospora crassa]|uniref:Uncharacterized protein n=1 Tax=Neurospora crassa (strain ATCC 24698 / 74-OR23-1A / CBS 708.71 / DSM 1257 / FGSC 987) TaxID=367110 RepID=Q7S2Z4_NEUCR|nr:hypothetical protein NCU08975 [Neurospora crassa OR74A]EAA29767.1 hypothetical protein NCU08975 [Neurospora crassa OR74A]KHE82022.1 hypothetical protein GE21DRAFT_4841 [Neurospora crassa]|eukprot:XP_959003.1 hypothetical protein NCU08975 [Neurospora crassa OR74A]